MANFERLVRPFVPPTITPPRTVQRSGSSGGPQSITIGGTANSGDQLALTVSSTAIAGSPVTVTFTLGGGDTLASAAVGLVSSINGNSSLQAAGVSAAIVPSRPLDLTVSQPTSLNPQATFTSAASGTITMTLSSGNVAISPGRRGSVKVMNSSFSDDRTFYTKKWPRETTLQEALAGNVPL